MALMAPSRLYPSSNYILCLTGHFIFVHNLGDDLLEQRFCLWVLHNYYLGVGMSLLLVTFSLNPNPSLSVNEASLDRGEVVLLYIPT